VNQKADFFYKTNRFESIRITNRIDSNRELESSTRELARSSCRGLLDQYLLFRLAYSKALAYIHYALNCARNDVIENVVENQERVNCYPFREIEDAVGGEPSRLSAVTCVLSLLCRKQN